MVLVSRSAEELLRLPVRVRDIEVGQPVDLIVDPEPPRVLGIDVLCRDDTHRFLPLAVAAVADDAIEIESPLVLLDFGQVSFYRDEGSTLRGYLAADGNPDLRDVLIAADGTIHLTAR